MRDKGTGQVVLNQCAQQASLKFLFVSHSIRSLNFLKVKKEAGVQNAQMHDWAKEYKCRKEVRKLHLQKNILVFPNGKLTHLCQLASLFRRPRKFLSQRNNQETFNPV